MVISKSELKPGSIDAWLSFLEKIDPNRIKLGLDRAKKVLENLNLQNLKDIKIVEVAGTNGKGSTAALIANSLSCSGIKTGLYTSPHLKRFNERIAIDGRLISDDDLC
ncbi:MAG: bifunctional folylpolyglutamate synthase/dihydrofolate synthase, partial [Succinivibrio sp.]